MDYEKSNEINRYCLATRMLTGRLGLLSIFLSVKVQFGKHSKSSKASQR